MSGALLVSVLLLAFNAFFVGASFALVSARRSQIEPLAAAGDRRARRALRAMERLAEQMAGAQFGITVCSVGLGALAEPALSDLLDGPLRSVGLPEGSVEPVAFLGALLVVVFCHVLFGEMVPKNLTLAVPDRAVVLLAPTLSRFSRALGPVLGAIRGSANGVLRLLRIKPTDAVEHAFGLPEVAAMAAESHREGLLDDEEYRLMARALDFTTARAADVAIPMAKVHTLPVGAGSAQVEALAVRTRHMRFPVLDAGGRPVGYVHAKDLLHPVSGAGPSIPVLRPLPVIAADTPLPDALTQLREARAPMAVIGTRARPTGVLTLDDVVVALVRARVPTAPPSP
jgi:CBS domain containing-hemolysin-like protein